MILSYKNHERLNGLKEAKAWLLGLKISESDLSRVNRLIEYIESYVDKGGQKLPDSELDKYSESIFDSFSFIELYRHFSQFDLGKHKDLLGKIKLACRILSLAKEKDTKPRDHLFELELACFLDSKHFGVKAYDDIQILVGNTPVIIECKRLSSLNKVGENVKKAVTQLQEYFDANTDCKKGCVALSFDKIIDFNGNLGKENSLANLINNVAHEFNAQEKAMQLSNAINKRYRQFWTKIIDIRIIAVIQVIRFAVRIQDVEHVYYFP
ncbi:hypothetical protein EOM81_10090, partial [bacterium]|nr:hypothetical protein [bacterium]